MAPTNLQGPCPLCAAAAVLFPKSTVLSGTVAEWDVTYKVNVFGVCVDCYRDAA